MRIHTRGLPITQSMAVVLLPASSLLLLFLVSNNTCKRVVTLFLSSPWSPQAQGGNQKENHFRKSPGSD